MKNRGLDMIRIVMRGAAVCVAAAGVFLFAAASCPGGGGLKDGTYDGEHSFVEVSVTIKGGKIADIKMTRHGGGGQKYEAMVAPLLDQMVDNQSTEVDAVSGATVSSDHLKKAVEKALKKAAAGKK